MHMPVSPTCVTYTLVFVLFFSGIGLVALRVWDKIEDELTLIRLERRPHAIAAQVYCKVAIDIMSENRHTVATLDDLMQAPAAGDNDIFSADCKREMLYLSHSDMREVAHRLGDALSWSFLWYNAPVAVAALLAGAASIAALLGSKWMYTVIAAFWPKTYIAHSDDPPAKQQQPDLASYFTLPSSPPSSCSWYTH